MMKVVGTFKVNGIDYVTVISGNNACAMKKKKNMNLFYGWKIIIEKCSCIVERILSIGDMIINL